MSNRRAIVVFTGDLAFAVRKGVVEIDRAIDGLSWLIVVHAPNKTPRQLLRNQWRNLRRNGWRWIPYQLADIWRRFFSGGATLGNFSGPGAEFSPSAFAARPNVRILEVPDIHAGETIEAVKAFAPLVGLSLSAPILRRQLFSIPTVGTLNLHKGKVPDYRGMPPAFWELWNDEQSVGCTVHWVDEQLDTGAVAAQAEVKRERFSTLRGLQLELDEVGVELMRDVVCEVVGGRLPAAPQLPGGRTFRKPTLAQVAALRGKLASEQPSGPSVPVRLARALLSLSAHWAWRTLGWRLMRPRISVLLYHRVSDSVRDNLTVGIEQFDRQMALLRKHCTVLPIEDVLDVKSLPRCRKPAVCVTFDDGYLDNYVHAVPSLLRHQIPAAFFVSTGIVSTDDQRFRHDVRRGNPLIPVMQWDQLRKMKAAGFTIGSHTVTHIDCASEPTAVVWDELVRSQADLHRELGLETCILAYPYGGRQHMTPDRLDLVKQAGYSGCLAAYGGVNIGAVDRFDVRRGGISWAFTDHAFLFTCLGIR